MNLVFTNMLSELEEGIKILTEKLGFTYSYDGDGVRVEINPIIKGLSLSLKSGRAVIGYGSLPQFFRVLGILVKSLSEGKTDFYISEASKFNKLGAMLDTSRHAALNIKTIKSYIENMALMGYSELFLYMEDTYELEGYPYFGYLRGRYSYNELKECDDYALQFGMKIVPAIQTLGHFLQVFKKGIDGEDRSIIEDEDLIRIGDEKTYEFIERLIKTASRPFRSKRIHLGMDEAFALGKKREGIQTGDDRTKLLIEHIVRVCDITKRLGLEPIVWSDSFFRFASKSFEYYDLEAGINKEISKALPPEISIMYEDSRNETEEGFKEFIDRHKALERPLILAPAVSRGEEFCFNYEHIISSANAAVLCGEKENIEELVAVSWGDGGATLSNIFSLYGLFYYAELNYSFENAKENADEYFTFCTKCESEIFKEISKLDRPMEKTECDNLINPTKFILRQDILMGMYDYDIKHVDWKKHYEGIKNRLIELLDESGDFRMLTEFYILLCNALSMKAVIGINLKTAYDNKDKNALARLLNINAPELKQVFEKLTLDFNRLWRKYNRPFAVELMDMRIGSICARIETLKERVSDYLTGKIGLIEELEEERRPFNRIDKAITCRNDITYGTPKAKVATAYTLGRF